MQAPLPILWWNRTVFAATAGEPAAAILPEGQDELTGLCSFISGLEPVPKVVRLIYGSAKLEHSSTTCPRGSRAIVQRALAARYPAIASPLTAWAAHKVRATSGGSTTLLYIEQESLLARLRAALDERGIALESAFPLLALLEAQSIAGPRDRPSIAVLHTDEASAVYWITADGDRHASFFDGPTARERTIQELNTGFAAFAGKSAPAFTIVNLGFEAFDLPDIAPGPAREVLPAEFLSHAADLNPRDLSNFLPPRSRISLDLACRVSAFALFIAAVVLIGTYLAAIRDAQANIALQRTEEGSLARKNAELRANKDHLGRVNAVLRSVAIAPPIKVRFLDALNRARPAQISIRSVAFNESAWTVNAYAHEGVNVEKGPYQAFIAALEKTSDWTIGPDSRAPVIRQPEFSVSGTIP